MGADAICRVRSLLAGRDLAPAYPSERSPAARLRHGTVQRSDRHASMTLVPRTSRTSRNRYRLPSWPIAPGA